jgi:uncharacterized protein
LERIVEHAKAHQLEVVNIGLHGGEPLLAGAGWLDWFLGRARRRLDGTASVRFTLQTNGVLLTPAIADVLVKHGVRVGVSLDGDRTTNDRRRYHHGGRSSYDEVVAGLEVMGRADYRASLGGLLCTIDVESDPLETYRTLRSFGSAGIDFLLPHGNWDSPPPSVHEKGDRRYADWLIPIFDEWYGERPRAVSIRIFDEIVKLLLGGRSGFEALGLAPINLVVIETDGTIEGVDTLKSTFEGAGATGRSVSTHSFDDVLRDPTILARQIGVEALSGACRACHVRDVCGGGYFPHRYRTGTGFKNPSVYCRDLEKLILHVRERVSRDLETLGVRVK